MFDNDLEKKKDNGTNHWDVEIVILFFKDLPPSYLYARTTFVHNYLAINHCVVPILAFTHTGR